jgi:Tfp pilus assembly protein PilN
MTPVRLEFPAPASGLRQWLSGHAPARTAVLTPMALAAALACGAVVAWQALQVQAELTRVRESLQAVQREKGRRPAQSAEPVKPLLSAQQRQGWSQMARQLNTPWAALLDALEATTPDTIALVSIEPDASQGSVRLQVEAKTLDTLLAYAKSLNSVPLFASVNLTKHETNEQDGNRPLRLSVDIRLKSRQGLQAATAESGAR